ncbi:MAG: hypothetical protein LUE12_08920 [Ruminococcus sp.]|nr:hypothetical protein [Ruminococcus sp.]
MKSKAFVSDFFHALDKNNIKYAVLRKADEVAEGTAHDIDMTVDYGHIKRVLEELDQVAETDGWMKILVADKDSGNLKTVHFATKDDAIEIVHFDLFKNFSWNSLILLTNSQMLLDTHKIYGIDCVSYSVEIATKLMSRLLYHGYVKEEYKDEISESCKSNPETIETTLKVFMPEKEAKQLVESCASENWSEIESNVGQLRKVIENCTKRNHAVTGRFSQIKYTIRRFAKPQGVMVAFIGSDGSGKSTIISSLPDVLGNTFDSTQIKYYHWRPGFIKSPKGEKSGSNKDTTVPHSEKPYGKGISYVKYFYYNVDYILGYFFKVKKHLLRNELVVFDRYYYDYLIDKSRYRLDISDSVIRGLQILIPRPNITFLLVGTPGVLYNRKKELSIEEITEQIERIKGIKVKNKVEINVDQNIETVVTNVSRQILKYMNRRLS